jgi:hypothetical protein
MRSKLHVFLAVLLSGSVPASAQFITVHGGPTYTPGVGGFQGEVYLNWNDAQSGLFDGFYGAGTALKYDAAGLNLGRRPFRFHWDCASAQLQTTDLDGLGTDTGGVALGVNRVGTVVGWAGKYDGAGVYKGDRAVRWDPSGTVATELVRLP